MLKITLSNFEIEMLDQYVDLYMETYSKEPWNESWESRDIVEKFIRNHYKNNYFLGFIAKKDKEIVGICLGFSKPWIKGMEYYIDEFFIAPNYQNKGIGKKFMEEIREHLINIDINNIMLLTKRDYPAQTFYENIDFKVHEDLIFLSNSF